MNLWMRGLLGFFVCLILGVSQAHAVALGKIEVASHLGEAFFAEVPLQLKKNEIISNVFVELAAPADYRILEVYRDPSLNAIHSNVKNDSRGTRVELSSDSVINAPFFNLVLKVRHGHATQFKKYPVFLDLPQARPVQAKVLPTVSAVGPQAGGKQTVQPEASASIPPQSGKSRAEVSTGPAFKAYDGWARTGRYGPMVYGDTISTVARRLRVDGRYTMPQVVMALFNKNKRKFSQSNVNLINAGTYLDVPKASEVESLTPSQAKSMLAQHNRAWSALKKQPRYAAVAEAQKNRYKTRVRVGKSAGGVASSPVASSAVAKGKTKSGQGQSAGNESAAAVGTAETAKTKAMQQAKLLTLQQKNYALQKKLTVAEDKVSALSGKLAGADVAVAKTRIKKLELRLARLQADLDRSRQAAKSGGVVSPWLTYLLAGLVIVLLGGVGYLLRRERPHPAATTAGVATDHSSPAPSLEDEVQEFEEFEEVTPEVPVAEESVEEPGQATEQMPTQEFKNDFTDSVPDLTEADTAEMEALQTVIEETPDPNVDYMAESGVYLRYGMDDEAIGQIHMAIKQNPNNADAHSKLVQVLQSKGDQAALDAAIEAARTVLSGESLESFEAVLSKISVGDSDIDLSDTLPPTGIEAIDFSATGDTETDVADESADEDQDTLVLGAEIDMGETESPEGESEQPAESTVSEEVELADETTIGRKEAEVTISEEPAAGDETDTLEIGDLDMGDMDWDSQPIAGEEDEQKTVVETVVEPASGKGADSSGLPASDVTEPELDADETATPEVTDETDQTEESEASRAVSSEADLDLSGIEIPDVSDATEGGASSFMETSDLEKTIAIDWSGDTEALEEATGGFSVRTGESSKESSAEDDGTAIADTPDNEQKEAEEKQAEKPFNPQSSGVLDIGLDEVDVNKAEPPSSDDADEFTSTVRMTVDEDEEFPDIGLESVELEIPGSEEEKTGDALADIDIETSDAESDTTSEKDEAGMLEPEFKGDDITTELDGLLTELDTDTGTPPDADTSVDSLNIDKARSLLAEGALDEAESSFKAAADAGDKRADGLLGLAEVAQRKGDASKAAELLTEAEALVDDSNRDWFESIKSEQDS